MSKMKMLSLRILWSTEKVYTDFTPSRLRQRTLCGE